MEEIILADLTNPAHRQALVFLLNEYAKDEMGGQSELPDWVKNHLADELHKKQGAHVILAFVDDQPAGLINCFEGFSTFACQPLLNIHDVVVLADYRGRGISKKMLLKAEELAANLGCCKLTLEVLNRNQTAQAAYQASGYSDTQMQFWQKKL